MNNRISTVIATAILVTLLTGCRGSMSNLWFGRGAGCGSCNAAPAPRFGNCLPWRRGGQPCGAPGAPCQAGPCQAGPPADCGCNHYAGECHDPGYGSAYGGDCGCAVDGYGETVNDPYLSGGAISTVAPYEGQVYEGQIIEGQPLPSSGLPLPADNWQPRPMDSYPSAPSGDYQSRKFDSDGNRILWEEPLPAGVNAL